MSTKEANRVLSLRIERKKYPSQSVERYITYRGRKIDLDDSLCNELLSVIPDMWNTEKDRLIQFVWFEDRTFFCVRNKDIYNFSIKQSEEKIYFFDSVTTEQLNSLVRILVEFYNKINLDSIQNFYDVVYDSLADLSFTKQKILQMRDQALRDSDYMFNSDYTFKSIEEEESWKKYRQDWRDITEKDFWIENDFLNISLPVSPKPKDSFALLVESLSNSLVSVKVTDNLLKDLDVDFDGYSELATKYGNIMFKLEIIKTLTALKMPVFLVEETSTSMNQLETLEKDLITTTFSPLDLYNKFMTVYEIEDESNDLTMKSILDRQIQGCEEKLQLINEKLKEYNIDFSISDIIEKYLEDMKLKAIEIEKEQEAENLLDEIAMGETP